MRAVRTVDGGFRVVEVDDPTGDGVMVDVASAGICGSDLHMAGFGLSNTFGHEVAGRLSDGTEVAIRPTLACGTCDRCAAGAEQQCRAMALYGLAMDGGMADRILIDPACIVPLVGGVPVSDACLVEPIAVSVHAVNVADVQPGQRVLVVGGGTIGLTAVAAARHLGAEVDLSARHAHQMAAGERLGAGTAASGEYDVVIEAAGTESALVAAIDHARPGGTVAIPAVYWEGIAIPNVMSMFLKEVSLRPSSMYGCSGRHGPDVREVDEAAALLAAVPELSEAVITHRFSLDDAPEAFRVAADRSAGAIKVVLEP